MNQIPQQENGIFATEEDLLALAKKSSCNILVLSDSHGAKELLLCIMRSFAAKCDAVIFCGDGIYDLLYSIESILKEKKPVIPPVIAAVRGNNDPTSASSEFCKKIRVPAKIILQTATKKLLITHGNAEHVYYGYDTLEITAQAAGTHGVIFGHTHIPAETLQKAYLLNPGSISCPRHGSKPSFAMLEINGNDISAIFYKIEGTVSPKFTPYFPEPFYGF